MKVIKTTVYTIDELSSAAKQEARQWWIDNLNAMDYADSVYEGANEIAKLMGIEISQNRGQLDIYWSGFSSQGDGASFKGYFQSKADNQEDVKGWAPLDETLRSIAADMDMVYDLGNGQTCGKVTTRGPYSHSGTMVFDFHTDYTDQVSEADQQEAEKLAESAMRRFADWIYRQLEESYNDACSDEQVDDVLRSNEYTFTSAGRRYGRTWQANHQRRHPGTHQRAAGGRG